MMRVVAGFLVGRIPEVKCCSHHIISGVWLSSGCVPGDGDLELWLWILFVYFSTANLLFPPLLYCGLWKEDVMHSAGIYF